ncbi:hypothetical protein EPI10_007464 [Gossypium australe]|uniref:Gag-pro-like protein n=1 Tax=Gossypium australe TaxID=47621 RepID=A0A5B6WVL0_9ROSI|nr:hypothetical protein EPI10_007464 [Gossypium australe]
MLGGATKSFSDIVLSGEMIENAIRNGKIEAGESARKTVPKKRENDINNIGKSYSKPITVSQPRTVTPDHQSPFRQESNTRQNTEKIQFTPIPVPYKEMYQKLFDAHIVAPHYLKPLQPPYPKWYDANAQCEYHAGIVGHSIEHCLAFKKLVERLIQMGVIEVDDTSYKGHPLPNHGVNMIGEDERRRVKRDISDVKTPMKQVWKEMIKKGLIVTCPRGKHEGTRKGCEFHNMEGHEIQSCTEFRMLVQALMDNKELEFYESSEGRDEGNICTLEDELAAKASEASYPLPTAFSSEDNQKAPGGYNCNVKIPEEEGSSTKGNQEYPRIVIRKPAAFSYKDDKKVPWNYNCNVTIPERGDSPNTTKGNQEVGSYTRSGKRYDIVVEQLHKQPACISVLDLLLSSEAHRNALMKVLNETYVANDITVNKLDRLVSNISADNFIFFNDDEIPLGGTGSIKALHITTRCKGYTLPGVLVDNGSSLNVLPLSTLNQLPVDNSHMKACHNVVRAFDGTERKVMGRIEVPLLIGPGTYEVDFIVMDIRPSYNCLLERPWIHSAGAVPSSLHQKLKLIFEGRLVTINAEEDIIATVTNSAPYLEANDEAVECSFRSLEFVNATFVIEGKKIPVPQLSKTTKMGLQLMVGNGAVPGK